MNTNALRSARTRPGAFTLLELLLAISITVLVGVGVASMLALVSDSTSEDADRRSALVRAHAAQVRLRAYVAASLCVLKDDPDKGIALWLNDQKPVNNVHLSEVRIVRFDGDQGVVTVEWLRFPDSWPQTMQDENDEVLPADADFFAAMEARRTQGHTAIETLVDGVASFGATLSAASAQDSLRVAFALEVEPASGGQTTSVMFTYGLANHRKPAS